MRPAICFSFPLIFFVAMVTSVDSGADEPQYAPEERAHWSLQPRRQVSPPIPEEAAQRAELGTAVDAFILARLERAGLHPAPPADRHTLIRRITLDLTGLPPTPLEIETFVQDSAPDAYARLVDRLLASPRYGEHWGQHWLDVVRYAETEGFEYDRYRPGAWRFRDYIIESFNVDKPYDQFVTEQLAGDELGPDDHELLVAAGFHRLGPVRRNQGNPEVAFSRNEVLTERTDIVGAAFLGLTVGCARCHDHMFDPIRQTDYYQMQAFLAATYEVNRVLANDEENQRWRARTDKVGEEIKKIKETLSKARGDAERQLREELLAAESRLPAPLPTISTVGNQDDERTAIHLLERGDPDYKGDRLEPRFLGVLLPEGASSFAAEVSRPKTRLANWIRQPDHPLTARVLVNRIWRHHFGVGLVATPNDFGLNGALPSHPELLDYLANEFVASGWSIKHLHRLLLLSVTYRQATQSDAVTAAVEADPENRLLWRFRRRRLMAHELRDAMLAVSGSLDTRMGGPSVMVPVDEELVGLLYKPTQWQVTPRAADHHRRSIYLIAKRNLRLPFLEIFDQPDLQTSCAARESSTHAPQALELLNGEMANRLSRALAARLRRVAGSDHQEQVALAFQLVTGRPPTSVERERGVEFLSDQPLEEFALAMFNLNALLYID